MFEDIHIVEVETNLAKDARVRKAAKELWLEWCSISGWVETTPPEKFVRTVGEQNIIGTTMHKMSDLVELAAYLPLRRHDKDGSARPLATMTSLNTAAKAGRLRRDGAEVYRFSSDTVLSTELDVVEACATPLSLWSDADHLACDALVRKYTPEELHAGAEDTAFELRSNAITPTELLRGLKGSTRRKKAIDVHEQGRLEAEARAVVDFEADPAAERRYLAGYPMEEVAAFHDQAPKGYWSEVTYLMAKGLPVTKAHDTLEDKYQWHPNRRTSR